MDLSSPIAKLESALTILQGVVVVPPPVAPSIAGFTVTPATLPAGGGNVSLSAVVANAAAVFVDGVPVTSFPHVVAVTASRTFTLTATAQNLPTAMAMASVTVAAVVTPPPGGGVLATLAPGYARNLGPYTSTLPDWITKSRNIIDDSGTWARPGQFGIRGGSHGISQQSDTHVLDTLTGQWSALELGTRWAAMTAANADLNNGRWLDTNTPICNHTYSMQVVVPAGFGRPYDRLYVMTRYGNPDNLPGGSLPSFTGRICWCELDGPLRGVWTFGTQRQTWHFAGAAAYDPIGDRIYVVALDDRDEGSWWACIWRYNVAADTIERAGNGNPINPQLAFSTQPVELCYCNADDNFYAFPGAASGGTQGEVWRITVNRANHAATTAVKLTTTGSKPPGVKRPPGTGYPSLSWDGKRFGGAFEASTFYTFDPVALNWAATPIVVESGSVGPVQTVFSCSSYDPLTRCYFALDLNGSTPKTWAYRPAYTLP